MENKWKASEWRSRLPRMNAWNQVNGQQRSATDSSSIPRPTKTVNNNKIINKSLVCNNTDREELNTSDNRNKSND